jgi:aspartyl-tRNA(Asn)/glutamyl-tRNA(Gln) amidotransferase subunit C
MNIKDVENLAELARLELSMEEKEAMLKDMDGILAYVKQVEELKIPETKANFSLYNTWREDLPRLSQAGRVIPREFSSELIAEQFPDSKDGFLKVKKIL